MLLVMLHVSSLQNAWIMISRLTSCLSLQISYQKALAAVFIEGCIFILLALTGAPSRHVPIDTVSHYQLASETAGLHVAVAPPL